MPGAPDLAALAALIGDPARARMLTALMAGSALTATELAVEAGIAPSTASVHLAKLTEGRVLVVERQGRHRYFRLADPTIAELLEDLMGIAATRPRPRRRTGPADPALRTARVCYDHLAGERGVWLLAQLRRRGILAAGDGCALAPGAGELLADFGVDLVELGRSRRALCRLCLDWSERRHHLGGALGAAILRRILACGWARRELGSRALVFSPHGDRELRRAFDGE